MPNASRLAPGEQYQWRELRIEMSRVNLHPWTRVGSRYLTREHENINIKVGSQIGTFANPLGVQNA